MTVVQPHEASPWYEPVFAGAHRLNGNGELTGLEPKFAPTDQTLQSVMTDDSRMRALTGPAEVPWKQGLREMVETVAPELLR